MKSIRYIPKINSFILLVIILLFLQSQNLLSQSLLKNLEADFQKSKLLQKQSTDSVNNTKNYLIPAVEIIGLNLTVLFYNDYLTKEGWANISIESAKNNLKYGFTWDNDGFAMNQFYHPYHGASYFNSARSNGLSFWESAPYTLGGSLMWEYFMEIERPSYNDLINTTVSGITLGEITYRVSNLIIDESTTGLNRTVRELTAFLINPMHGFNRLIRGRIWKKGSKPIKNVHNINLSLGSNSVFINRNLQNNYFYLLLKFDMTYGKKFNIQKHKNPFDYFRVHSEVSFTEGNNIIGISASGVLWDDKLSVFENDKSIIGFYKEFDLLFNSIYKFSASSFTAEITNLTKFSNTSNIRNSIGLSLVLIGSSNSEYSSTIEKDYNLGPGLGFRLYSDFRLAESWLMYFKYKQFLIHVLNGIEGEEFIGLFNLGLVHEISENISIGADAVFYERYGIYTNLPDIYSKNASLRTYFVYHF